MHNSHVIQYGRLYSDPWTAGNMHDMASVYNLNLLPHDRSSELMRFIPTNSLVGIIIHVQNTIVTCTLYMYIQSHPPTH